MAPNYLHVTRHWEQSKAIGEAAVVFSELPRGGSPVEVRTRAINYVIEGIERYEVDGRTFVVRPGEFLFVDAGTRARAAIPEAGTTRGLCVYLAPTPHLGEVEPGERAAGLEHVFQMSGRMSGFGRLLDGAARKLARDGAMRPDAVAMLVREAEREFDQLESQLALELMRIDAIKPSTRQDLLQRIYRARAFLHDHVDRPVPLARLAAVAGMSQFHLARSFRAVFGTPPGQYHAELRIRMADEALRRGRLSIGEAAQHFGFAETSSFSRAFLRIAGITPGEACRDRPARIVTRTAAV